MGYYDEKLKTLQQQTARFRQLCSTRKDLRDQEYSLEYQLKSLEQIKLAEQADVDRLEGRTLAAFFYNAIGTMGEKLDKERQEAYAARLKYDTAYRELEALREDLRRCINECDSLEGCEEQYQMALEEKMEAIEETCGPAAEALLGMEDYIRSLEYQKEELQEAIDAGKHALAIADRISQELGSAEDWSTFDLMGGGIIADSAKYRHLDAAQASVNELQAQLRCFRSELADVVVQTQIQIEIDDFISFADYFFDSFFADWAVMERIRHAQEQVQNTKDQIEDVLDTLEGLLSEIQWDQAETQSKLETLILETQL